MKKYIKLIFPIILLFVLLIVHFTHIGANSQTIGPIKKGNLLKYNGYDSLYFKYYTLGNNTDVAAFSTLFQASNISTGQCELTNNWSEGIKAGIATIIKKAQEDNSNINTAESKEYYYAELAGATLVLINSDGEEIERWVTTSEPRQFTNLAPGTYTIKAVSAPDGYQLNKESVTFTIDENGLLNGETIIYSTPLTDVPNTLSTQSIIIIVFGVILI